MNTSENSEEHVEQAIEAPEPVQVDAAQIERIRNRIHMEQNLFLGMIAGIIAALIGAIIWATITVVTQFQIGWLAVGVGFLVGFAVRIAGKGVTNTFGIVGAVCALLGCLLGNAFAICGFVAQDEGVSVINAVASLFASPTVMLELMKLTFSPMDLLFYGIAVYEGYKFSFRQMTSQDLERLTNEV